MKVKLLPCGDGCVGSIEIPTALPGRVVAQAKGADKADALLKASVLAQRIASDPLVNALLPASALANIRAARMLARAAQAGPAPLRRLWSRLRGPGKRRLAAALHHEAVQLETPDVGAGGWIPAYWAGQEGPDNIEVGIGPLAIFAAKYAAKYGPQAARLAVAKIKARQRRKAAARRRAAAAQAAAAAAAAQQEQEQEQEEPEAEEPEAEGPEADNIEGQP